MSKNTSDKHLAIKTIFGSLAAIIIAYVLLGTFSHQVGGNFKNAVYVTGFIILAILFVASSIWAYFEADSATNDNKSRAFVVVLAAIIIIWAGSWVAGSNEVVKPGSPQMENAKADRVQSYKGMNEYLKELDSLAALPNTLVISDNYNTIVIDTSEDDWRKVLDSIRTSQHKSGI